MFKEASNKSKVDWWFRQQVMDQTSVPGPLCPDEGGTTQLQAPFVFPMLCLRTDAYGMQSLMVTTENRNISLGYNSCLYTTSSIRHVVLSSVPSSLVYTYSTLGFPHGLWHLAF